MLFRANASTFTKTEVDDRLDALQQQVFGIENLYDRFINYQAAFNKLVVEIARRRVYKEAAENIVQRMVAQLEAMTQEESDLRRHFNEEYGEHLPDDLCLSIGNQPTRWDVAALPGEIIETLPEIPQDMVRDVSVHVFRTRQVCLLLPVGSGTYYNHNGNGKLLT